MSALHQPLAKNLRTQLENTVKSARNVAEIAARAALTNLGVGEKEAHNHLTDEQKLLRRRLRAHGRQLGDIKYKDDSQEIRHLVWEVAYEQWHRMLFARFLAENHLLMWEPGASVTLSECNELAQDVSTSLGAKSGWELAGILASRMLPQIFKPQSPALTVIFAPEHQRELEKLLSNLSNEVFHASDSLGWVYQFWQATRKQEINNSTTKIGADELPAVTQLFTEPYMVDFLLHNSLGAWWMTRNPCKPCPVPMPYLRLLDDGSPVAGNLEAWPDSLKEFKLLDPCCGSGHFLVAGFLLLVPMRMAAEGLTATEAVYAVIEQNLHGLEIDPRCVEIAVFALALTAWRYPDESGKSIGVRSDMKSPNIACCGLKVSASPSDWEALVPTSAPDADLLRQELRILHANFNQAPILGSLLDLTFCLKDNLATTSYDATLAILFDALTNEDSISKQDTDDFDENAFSAKGLLGAAKLMSPNYDLVITNVPYLARGKQDIQLKAFIDANYSDARHDLATVFIERSLDFCASGGIVSIVSPQNWWFLKSYAAFRKSLFTNVSLNVIAALGEEAWEYFGDRGPLATLVMFTAKSSVNTGNVFLGIDAVPYKTIHEKQIALREQACLPLLQQAIIENPDSRLLFTEINNSLILANVAKTHVGFQNGDTARFIRNIWEIASLHSKGWRYIQMPPSSTDYTLGLDSCISAEFEIGVKNASTWHNQSASSFGKTGVLIRNMRDLNSTVFLGGYFDQSSTAITCTQSNLPALWSFVSSSVFQKTVRQIEQKVNVTPATFGKITFDLEYWQQIAIEKYPNGLPKSYSDDPTQWVFHGHPKISTVPLQVATARLLGFAWPSELDQTMELADKAHNWVSRCHSLLKYVDDDGIVCLSPVRGEQAAHDRLLSLLISAWETVEPNSWKPGILDKLLSEVNCSGQSLDVWLRDHFFEQHAKLFIQRPYIWHIWDGLKDGFGVLVNYHKLDTKNLERLIHTYLGDWIRQQETGVREQVDGAETRLLAAQDLKRRLELILEGEKGYDIFVRWKSLAEQSIGWNPDLNDGVRLNIRPFMKAEVLRHNKKPKLNITWDKDRGKDVESAPWFHKFNGERINDHYLSLAEKIAAKGSET